MEEGKKNVFAEHLRELRARLSLTQKEFAQRVSITPATLSSYENGTKSPPISTVIRIAEEYKISLDWLCGIKSEDHSSGYRVSYEEGLKYFAYILKTFWSVNVYCHDAPQGPNRDIWGTMEIHNPRLSEFLNTLNSLIELNIKGALDDSMLEACVEKACSNTAPNLHEDAFEEAPF